MKTRMVFENNIYPAIGIWFSRTVVRSTEFQLGGGMNVSACCFLQLSIGLWAKTLKIIGTSRPIYNKSTTVQDVVKSVLPEVT